MSLWDFKANFYARARKIPPFNFILKKELAAIHELVSSVNLEDATILDVGTGTGTLLNSLPENSNVVAVDRSFKMVKQARDKRSLNCAVGDNLNLPFRSKSFTLVAAIGVFEYQQNRAEFLQELRRLLNESGFLILTYSQKSFLNYIRFILGHKIYLIKDSELSKILKRARFVCIASRKSLIQRQLLLRMQFGT